MTILWPLTLALFKRFGWETTWVILGTSALVISFVFSGYVMGDGIKTIARSALPLALFGSKGYGACQLALHSPCTARYQNNDFSFPGYQEAKVLPNRGRHHTVMASLHCTHGCPMPLYIAEYDEKQQIAAVWIKEKSARGPKIFDPKKHAVSLGSSDEFFGAPKEAIEKWVAGL